MADQSSDSAVKIREAGIRRKKDETPQSSPVGKQAYPERISQPPEASFA